MNSFKALDDEHRQAFGDAVLQQVGHRLVEIAGRTLDHPVARFSGDEFTLLAPMPAERDAVEFTNSLLAALEPRTMIERKAVVGRPAVGRAAIALERLTKSDLLRLVDAKMCRAKCSGPQSCAA